MKKTYSVDVSGPKLSKKECLHRAQMILREGRITEMTELELAKELYFHAWFYHTFKRFRKYNRVLDELVRHADPADLEDGGDTPFRRFCYSAVWNLTKEK